MQHPKTDDKRLPMADKEHHPKSLLNRYGTILRWIKEICNQGDSFAWDKPQADHLKSESYTKVALFFMLELRRFTWGYSVNQIKGQRILLHFI